MPSGLRCLRYGTIGMELYQISKPLQDKAKQLFPVLFIYRRLPYNHP